MLWPSSAVSLGVILEAVQLVRFGTMTFSLFSSFPLPQVVENPSCLRSLTR